MTGMSQMEILKDLAEKQSILQYMIDHKLRDITSVGNMMNLYYIDKDIVLEAIKKKLPPTKLLGIKLS